MKNILLLILISIIMFGCDDFTSEQRYKDDYYVITGLLYEGEPIYDVFIGRTISPGGSLTDFNIPDADVEIEEFNENGEFVQTIPLTYFEFQGFGIYADATMSNLVTEGYSYKISAQIGEELVWAETDVPGSILINEDEAFTFDENAADFPDLSYATADSEHPIIIQTDSNDEINLMFKFLCLEEFEDEPQYVFSFGSHNTPDDLEEYEANQELEFYSSYLPVWNEELQSFAITERSYSGPFVYYGDYEITIYSISRNYYNYLYKPDGYAHGGIHNGFGYFGAVSGEAMYTEVVE